MTIQKISLRSYFKYKKKPSDYEKPSEELIEIINKIAKKYGYEDLKKDES
jgi:hypothetical protein